MTAIFWLTTLIIFIYLIYPIWLGFISINNSENVIESPAEKGNKINSVSLILLSYNGREYLKEKIGFLIKELSSFQNYELIIIDDNSNDGSKEILSCLRCTDNIKIIIKNKQQGIPDSMNIGVFIAKYNYIVFCDQRQRLSKNIIQQIIKPLKNNKIGAISGCISHHDKNNCYSFLRNFENFLKSKESYAGSLIGVYGPFYAIKKDCYSVIPDKIILDDLYLSLRILKNKQIRLIENCQIVDDNFSKLYDYKRSKRYLAGFVQILKEKNIIRDLNYKQIIMLIWHKYLRLMIPVFLLLSYIGLGIMIFKDVKYFILFIFLTVLIIISIVPFKFSYQFKLKNLIRFNVQYIIAFFDIIIINFPPKRIFKPIIK